MRYEFFRALSALRFKSALSAYEPTMLIIGSTRETLLLSKHDHAWLARRTGLALTSIKSSFRSHQGPGSYSSTNIVTPNINRPAYYHLHHDYILGATRTLQL